MPSTSSLWGPKYKTLLEGNGIEIKAVSPTVAEISVKLDETAGNALLLTSEGLYLDSDVSTAQLKAELASSNPGKGAAMVAIYDRDLFDKLSDENYTVMDGSPTSVLDGFQKAAARAVSTNGHVIKVPLASGQVLALEDTLVWDKSNLSVYGDAAVVRAGGTSITGQNGGYITGIQRDRPIIEVQSPSTGHFHYEKLHFWGDPNGEATKADCAIYHHPFNNGPDRGITYRDLSIKGFEDAIRHESGLTTPSNRLAGATVNIESCNINGCDNTFNAINRVFGLRFVANQSEQGGRIKGYIDGPITIRDNMLEGQTNAIEISSNDFYVDIEGNYFELNGGDFVVSLDSGHRASTVRLGMNYVFNITATDVYKLKGLINLFDDGSDTGRTYLDRFSTITLSGALLCPRSSTAGRFYFDPSASSRGHLDPLMLQKNDPEGTVVHTNLGDVSLRTPFGDTRTGRTVTGFSSAYSSYRINYLTGDVIVTCALVKARADSVPYMALYNQDAQQAAGSVGQVGYLAPDAGWKILFEVSVALRDGTQIRARFGSNGTNASSIPMDIAGVGSYVIPAAQFETFNGNPRYAVEAFVPFIPNAFLEGSTTYDPPSIDAAGYTNTTFTVAGARPGDFVEASFDSLAGAVSMSAYVISNSVVRVDFHNMANVAVDMPSGTIKARVRR